jgi:hypothetical protein
MGEIDRPRASQFHQYQTTQLWIYLSYENQTIHTSEQTPSSNSFTPGQYSSALITTGIGPTQLKSPTPQSPPKLLKIANLNMLNLSHLFLPTETTIKALNVFPSSSLSPDWPWYFTIWHAAWLPLGTTSNKLPFFFLAVLKLWTQSLQVEPRHQFFFCDGFFS